MQNVAIIGVGLIGGSLGLGLKKRGFQGNIAGVARQKETLEKAMALGAIDQGFQEPEGAVRHADLIYLATPIAAILDLMPRIRTIAPAEAVVTDAGSTKAAIAERAAKLFDESPVFIGGHPMAGSERRGVESANPDLFEGATYILTPNSREHLEIPAVVDFRNWLERLGARVVVMDAELHDEVVAWTSHLPQLVATALATTVLENVSRDNLIMAGGGLRDTTRLAESAYSVWRDICFTNSENIADALNVMMQKLEYLRENLRSRALQTEFEAGQELRDKLKLIDPAKR
jgi:prephenate dehydrogenase